MKNKIFFYDYASHISQYLLALDIQRCGYEVNFFVSKPFNNPSSNEKIFNAIETSIKPKKPKNIILRSTEDIKISIELMYKIFNTNPNIVFISNSSFIIHLLLSYFCKYSKKVYLYHYTENYLELTLKNLKFNHSIIKVIKYLLYKIYKTIFNNCDHIISISSIFIDDISKLTNKKVFVLPLETFGVDKPKVKSHQYGRLKILYSGSLGNKYDTDLLLDIVKHISETTVNLDITIISSGEFFEYLHQKYSHHKNLHFLNYLPYEEYEKVLNDFDFYLILQNEQSARFTVPSKLYSFINKDGIVLVIGEKYGECYDNINLFNIGVYIDINDYSFEKFIDTVFQSMNNLSYFNENKINYLEYRAKNKPIDVIQRILN